MNRNFNLIGKEKITRYYYFLKDFTSLIIKNKIVDKDFMKLVNKISNNIDIIKKEKSFELDDIFLKVKNNKKEKRVNNSKNLVQKINFSYKKHFDNLSELKISESFDNLPDTLKVIYQINKLDSILFQPIHYEFTNKYISTFIFNKIYKMRKNNNFYIDIPELLYIQDIEKNNSVKMFENWFSSQKNSLQKEYKQVINSNFNEFYDKLTTQHMHFFKYSTDYLKSPFDENKVNHIYNNSIKILKKEKNRIFKFIQKKNQNTTSKEHEKIIKLIIQENMLDFISENILYEGFNMNLEFYKNKDKTIKEYENKKISFKLFEYLNNYIYKISNNETENSILIDEYFTFIRRAISISMIDYYTDLFAYYQIMYYGLNQDLNNNIKIKNLYIKYIRKYKENINKENKKTLIKMNINIDDAELSELINIYKFIINNMDDKSFIFNINDEEVYLIKFSDYFNFINKEINENKTKTNLIDKNIQNMNNLSLSY